MKHQHERRRLRERTFEAGRWPSGNRDNAGWRSDRAHRVDDAVRDHDDPRPRALQTRGKPRVREPFAECGDVDVDARPECLLDEMIAVEQHRVRHDSLRDVAKLANHRILPACDAFHLKSLRAASPFGLPNPLSRETRRRL